MGASKTDKGERSREGEEEGEGGQAVTTPFLELAFTRNDPMKQVPVFVAAFRRLHEQGLIIRERTIFRLRLWHIWYVRLSISI